MEFGLLPSVHSLDGVVYGENRIYFFTKPVLRTSEVDKYLQGRVQLEVVYDESYNIFRDKEYNHRDNFIVYATINEPITISKISEFQPRNMDFISNEEKMMVLEQIINRTEGMYN